LIEDTKKPLFRSHIHLIWRNRNLWILIIERKVIKWKDTCWHTLMIS
jgi:hypothetical protein